MDFQLKTFSLNFSKDLRDHNVFHNVHLGETCKARKTLRLGPCWD